MRTALAALLLAAGFAGAAGPDPLAVRRHGPAYRYPQAGWTVVHVEGDPADRGAQHGRLLAAEIAAYLKVLAAGRNSKSPADGWAAARTLVGAAFLPKFDPELVAEMKGIAAGAAAAGATFDGRPVDLLDIAALNMAVELDTLDDALAAGPDGPDPTRPKPPARPGPRDHCSAFAATGPATADGRVVVGHLTMWELAGTHLYNVWLDLKPTRGHRVAFQTVPGGVWSGMDYYLTGAGLVLAETTIAQTKYAPAGKPLADRARRAAQYAGSIDELARTLVDGNNGLCSDEWLLADANTNEIALLELGTTAHRLRRSSRGEWLAPGTEGFYWGCNNAKDPAVRLDSFPSPQGRPQDVTWRPSDRDTAWVRLFARHRGRIDAGFGKLALSSPPLAGQPAVDAKVTTADMARRLETHALFGPPAGRVRRPTADERADFPDIKPLVPNDWTVLTPAAPTGDPPDPAPADLADKHREAADDDPAEPKTAPAWHGILLPKTDADVWLSAGFAGLERVVALEAAVREKADGRPTPADRERVELALFRHRSDYLAAKANRPPAEGGDLDRLLDRARWHKEQVAGGVLALHALRAEVGAEAFDKAMDEFGLAHAGREVTAAGFAADVGRRVGKDVTGFLSKWRADPPVSGPTFSVGGWLDAPDHVVIVYGTDAEAAANREAAGAVQEAVRVKWSNVEVPVRSDAEVTDAELTGRHVVLVGRPATNRLARRWAEAVPVPFGPGSFTLRGAKYAHEGTAVAVAGANPLDRRFSVVLLAGLSAAATYRLPAAVAGWDGPACEVLLLPNGAKPRPLLASGGA